MVRDHVVGGLRGRFRVALGVFALAGLLATVSSNVLAQATAYPSKPIRFVVPYTPGGSTSAVARIVGEKLSQAWGQPVIIDNRPGGNTVIGAELVARSIPDGHTILFVTTTHITTGVLMRKLPFDSIKDFTPVTSFVSTELVLEVHPTVPANTLAEFLRLAKSKPGELNFGTVGTGGITHLAGEYFNLIAGIKTTHVPYKGTAPMLTDLLGGQLQFTFDTPISSLQHIKAGKLRALAVTGNSRLPNLPDIPTFAEAGLPDYRLSAWMGVFAPAGLPREITAKLGTEIARILAMPDVKERLAALGSQPLIMSPDQFSDLVREDFAKYQRIVREARISIEQ